MPTTKIKATESKPTKAKATVAKPKSNPQKKSMLVGAVRAFFAYFKDSWTELRKVRWPNRRATWGMTGAVLLFTALFIFIIVSLDTAFSQLFKLIIK